MKNTFFKRKKYMDEENYYDLGAQVSSLSTVEKTRILYIFFSCKLKYTGLFLTLYSDITILYL